jgi:hypothetical protein
VAVGLGLARGGAIVLPGNDLGGLHDARDFSHQSRAQSGRAQKPALVYGVVERGAHGAVMAVQSFGGENHIHNMGHLTGDVPALFLVALVLGLCIPRGGDRAAA